MILWRLTRRPHADLLGKGGELADARWHTRGRPVVYCASTAALAALEVRVHLDLPFDLLPDDYVLMQIATPDNIFSASHPAP
jgi:RES domain-containing protein